MSVYLRVVRQYGLYEPGDLLLPTFVRKKEFLVSGLAEEVDVVVPAAESAPVIKKKKERTP